MPWPNSVAISLQANFELKHLPSTEMEMQLQNLDLELDSDEVAMLGVQRHRNNLDHVTPMGFFQFQRYTTRTVCCALVGADADWVLIGACNPMVCPPSHLLTWALFVSAGLHRGLLSGRRVPGHRPADVGEPDYRNDAGQADRGAEGARGAMTSTSRFPEAPFHPH